MSQAKRFKVVLFGKYPIETVFDHATEEELIEFTKHCLGIPKTGLRLENAKHRYDPEAYKELMENTYRGRYKRRKRLTAEEREEIQDMAYALISEFYSYKARYEKAEEYVLKIKDHIIRYPVIAPLGAKKIHPEAIP